MAISKLCKECVWLKDCAGKPASEVKPGKLPCKKYAFDESILSQTDIEPVVVPSLKDKPKEAVVKPLIPSGMLVVNKNKAANFERLALKRLTMVLDGIRKLDNLTNKSLYEWTQEQADAVVARIRNAADALEKRMGK